MEEVLISATNQIESVESPCVLAVDDCEDNLVILCHVLEALGCLPVTATTSEDALSLVKKHQPQLILLDIVLPGTDGIELLKPLQDNLNSQATVIAVTGLVFKEEKSRILAAGFDDYLSKPYLLSDLEALILRHLKLPLCLV